MRCRYMRSHAFLQKLNLYSRKGYYLLTIANNSTTRLSTVSSEVFLFSVDDYWRFGKFTYSYDLHNFLEQRKTATSYLIGNLALTVISSRVFNILSNMDH